MTDEVSTVVNSSVKKKSLFKRWWFLGLFVVIIYLVIKALVLPSSSTSYDLSKMQNMSKQEIIEKFGMPDETIFDEPDHYAISYDVGFVIWGNEKGVTEISLNQSLIKKPSSDNLNILDVYLGDSFEDNIARFGKPNLLKEKDGKKDAFYLTEEEFLLILYNGYNSDKIEGIRYISYRDSFIRSAFNIIEALRLIEISDEQLEEFWLSNIIDKSTSQGETLYVLNGFSIIVDNESKMAKSAFISSDSLFHVSGIRTGDSLDEATKVFGEPVSSQEGVQNTTQYSFHYEDNSEKVIVNLSINNTSQKIGYIEVLPFPDNDIGVEIPDTIDATDIWPLLDIEEQIELNAFFSIFSNDDFGTNPYIKHSEISKYSPDELIKFAIAHIQNYDDGYDIDPYEDNYFVIEDELVSEVIQYYFGLDIEHKSVSGYEHKNGQYRWDVYRWAKYDTNRFSQVQSLYDNGDSTLTADIHIYQDLNTYGFWNSEDPEHLDAKSIRYIPQNEWIDNSMFNYTGSAQATIQLFDDGNWKLINYEIISMY